MTGGSYYEEDRPAMRRFLGWTGPIGADLRRRGRTLEFRSRTAPSPNVRSGKLRLDIETRERTVVDGLQIEVGNWNTPYAAAQHEGAKAHVILPKTPGGRLVFKIAGVTVFAKKVNHPGNPATHYLSRWLREAVQ